MKKIIIGIMLAAMMAAALCGCSRTAPAKEPADTGAAGSAPAAESKQDDAAPAAEAEKDSAADKQEDAASGDKQEDSAAASEDGDSAVTTYPGLDVVELVNARGDTVTVYQLADGTFMDRENRVYKYDGKESWYDQDNAEWNQSAEAEAGTGEEQSYPGPDDAVIVNARGDETTVYKLADGSYLDRVQAKFTYSEADNTWTDEDGVVWDEKAE